MEPYVKIYNIYPQNQFFHYSNFIKRLVVNYEIKQRLRSKKTLFKCVIMHVIRDNLIYDRYFFRIDNTFYSISKDTFNERINSADNLYYAIAIQITGHIYLLCLLNSELSNTNSYGFQVIELYNRCIKPITKTMFFLTCDEKDIYYFWILYPVCEKIKSMNDKLAKYYVDTIQSYKNILLLSGKI